MAKRRKFQVEFKKWIERWKDASDSEAGEQMLKGLIRILEADEKREKSTKNAEFKRLAIANTKQEWGQWDERLDACELLEESRHIDYDTVYYDMGSISRPNGRSAHGLAFRLNKQRFTIIKDFGGLFVCMLTETGAGFRSPNLIEVVDYLFSLNIGPLPKKATA